MFILVDDKSNAVELIDNSDKVHTPGACNPFKALGGRGFNVTTPHKVAVISFLDELDPLAARIGAVNTIVNDDGRLTGYNTDAAGFIAALRAADIKRIAVKRENNYELRIKN